MSFVSKSQLYLAVDSIFLGFLPLMTPTEVLFAAPLTHCDFQL